MSAPANAPFKIAFENTFVINTKAPPMMKTTAMATVVMLLPCTATF